MRTAIRIAASVAAVAAVAFLLAHVLGLGLLSGSTSLSLPAPAVTALAQDGMTPLGNTRAPAFTLLNQRGQRTSLATWRGDVVVLTFLDPVCWWDCPLQAAEMREMLAYLPPAARAHVALVAVDANPDVHSVAAVRAFVTEEGLDRVPAFQFLTSPSLSVLKAVWRHYYVTLSVDKNGMVAHPDLFYLIAPNGRLAYLSNPNAVPGNVGGTGELLAAYVARMLGTTPVFPPGQTVRWTLPFQGRSRLAMTAGPADMTSVNVGWRVAWSGPYEVLLHTTNQGHTWTNVSPTGISKRGGLVAAFGGGERAWVVVLPYGYDFTALAFATDDGGASWRLTRVLPGGALPTRARGILTASADTAYLLTRTGILEARGTGGWTRIAPVPAAGLPGAALQVTGSGQLTLTASGGRLWTWTGARWERGRPA